MTKMPKESTAARNKERTGNMTLRAVGVINNRTKEPFLKSSGQGLDIQGRLDEIVQKVHEIRQEESEIVIREDMADILDGLDGFSHLVVLYWAHKVPEESRLLTKIHPMGRKEIPLTGIYSTCSPARPNPVLMNVVRLRGREKNVLKVVGLDAIDGSPVVDIKPYIDDFSPQGRVVVADWMSRLQKELEEGRH